MTFATMLALGQCVFGQAEVGEWPPVLPELRSVRLANGVRVVQIPRMIKGVADAKEAADTGSEEPYLEIAFGYVVGPDDATVGRAMRSWLELSVPARTSQLLAHLGGGQFEFFNNPELTGIRLRIPEELADAAVAEARAFLDQRPAAGALLDYVLDQEADRADDGAASVMDRAAEKLVSDLLGRESEAGEIDAASAAARDIVGYFDQRIGTDRAWVLFSRPPTPEELDALGDIRPRPSDSSSTAPVAGDRPTVTEVALPSAEEGGVIVGSRIGGVYFEAWFNTLVLDRTLRALLGDSTRIEFAPSRVDTVHLLETRVLIPRYPEDVRASLVGTLDGLRFGLPEGLSLARIKQDALAWLASPDVAEWFAAQDLWGPFGEGWSRIWNLTEEDFRSAATAYSREPRITAVWAPRYLEPTVTVDALDAGATSGEESRASSPPRIAPGEIEAPALGKLPVISRDALSVERLSSGAGLAIGSPALFIAGPFSGDLPPGTREGGPNGTLWTSDDLDLGAVLSMLADVRPDRALFFLPSGDADIERPVLEEWSGGLTDATDAMGRGPVATIDLPALIILKTWLEGKIIEAGWSGRAEVRIAATEGSDLSIRTDAGREPYIAAWLKEARERFQSDEAEEEFLRLRAAAGAQFDRLGRDLRILLWQRAPEGRVLPPDTVSFRSFRNFLDLYY